MAPRSRRQPRSRRPLAHKHHPRRSCWSTSYTSMSIPPGRQARQLAPPAAALAPPPAAPVRGGRTASRPCGSGPPRGRARGAPESLPGESPVPVRRVPGGARPGMSRFGATAGGGPAGAYAPCGAADRRPLLAPGREQRPVGLPGACPAVSFGWRSQPRTQPGTPDGPCLEVGWGGVGVQTLTHRRRPGDTRPQDPHAPAPRPAARIRAGHAASRAGAAGSAPCHSPDRPRDTDGRDARAAAASPRWCRSLSDRSAGNRGTSVPGSCQRRTSVSSSKAHMIAHSCPHNRTRATSRWTPPVTPLRLGPGDPGQFVPHFSRSNGAPVSGRREAASRRGHSFTAARPSARPDDPGAG